MVRNIWINLNVTKFQRAASNWEVVAVTLVSANTNSSQTAPVQVHKTTALTKKGHTSTCNRALFRKCMPISGYERRLWLLNQGSGAMNSIVSVNTGWRTLVIICYHSVQTHHKHQAALCQLQPQPRGPCERKIADICRSSGIDLLYKY